MIRAALLSAAVLIALAAPAHARRERTPAIDYAPTPAPAPMAAPANGAIFQASMGYAPLTSGARAAQVGDLLTITLVESTQAANQTSATTSKEGNIGISPPTTGPLALFQASDASAGGTNTFKGAGQASQSAQLSGEITVTIAALYPNGTMLVRGQNQLRLNRGDEIIQLQGIVRAADISTDNRVLSTRVADARISYAGRGDVHRASKQGWLQHFFTILSPF
jgi:flagellar L-ring protein precursor FlgH